jgi:hypothetical protein
VGVLAAIGAAAGEAGEKVTVQGEILDLACWMAHEAKGAEHAKCAQSCVKGGQPMGLLAKDGQVYLLYASHDDASAFESAKQHAGKQVSITGVAGKRGGMSGLEVHAVQAL